jgi:hypothetical protein
LSFGLVRDLQYANRFKHESFDVRLCLTHYLMAAIERPDFLASAKFEHHVRGRAYRYVRRKRQTAIRPTDAPPSPDVVAVSVPRTLDYPIPQLRLSKRAHANFGDVRIWGMYTGLLEDVSLGLLAGFKLPNGDHTYSTSIATPRSAPEARTF